MKDASLEARSERLFSPARAQLRQFEQDDVPVLAGPWLGEIAFELLYWLPYLQWVLREFPALRSRLVVMSRGGAGVWYQGMAWRYLDMFDLFTLQEFRARFPKFLKQTAKHVDYQKRSYPEAEEALVELARREVGAERINVLHPSMMYETFKHLRYTSEQWIATSYQPLPTPDVAALAGRLPPRFIAARFYNNFSLPVSAANLAFAQSLLQRVADVMPVVLLDTGVQFDRKHADFPLNLAGDVSTVSDLMTASNNLTVQSAVAARASAFIGGYGGLSFLSPYYGCPSFALYSDPAAVKPQHRALAEAAFGKPNLAGYWMGRVDETTPEAVADMVLSDSPR